MDISILGYKFNVEILILIGVVYLILVGHTFCGCSNFSLTEGMDTMNDSTATPSPVAAGSSAAGKAKSSKEGFTGANINYGQSSPFDSNTYSTIDTSKWNEPDMAVIPGKPLSPGVKEFLAREPQPVPLPEGQLDMFATTPFKPECCPNTYSNSQGCACLTGQQYNWLIQRGGNNVPYSEY